MLVEGMETLKLKLRPERGQQFYKSGHVCLYPCLFVFLSQFKLNLPTKPFSHIKKFW